MQSKKYIRRIMILTLICVSILTPVFNNVHAVGGGCSPSIAWTYNKTYTKTLTAQQLRTLSSKYQNKIKSDKFVAGQYAANVTLAAASFMGKVPAIASTYFSIFGKTYHSQIQSSANVLASASAKNKSVKLRVKEYIIPANGRKMYLFTN